MATEYHIPWYANGFRGDRLQRALTDIGPTALRYGASSWSLHRGKDDRYRFLHIVSFEDKLDFERWWEGNEMIEFRVITSGWWQVPILYSAHELIGEGSQPVAAGEAAAKTTPAVTAEAGA